MTEGEVTFPVKVLSTTLRQQVAHAEDYKFRPSATQVRARLASAAIAIAAIGALGFLVRDRVPGGDGIAARFDAPTGESYLVLQQWNDWSEPYEVSFFMRTREGRWGWCYIDHQSHRVRDASIVPSVDGQTLVVYSSKVKLAEYDNAGHTFSLFDRSGQKSRTLPAPQEWQSPPPSLLR